MSLNTQRRQQPSPAPRVHTPPRQAPAARAGQPLARGPLVQGQVSGFSPTSKIAPQERQRMERLMPTIADAAKRHGVDPKQVAAHVFQESRGKNYLNHSPAQGGHALPTDRGLVGLNEKGRMGDFEKAMGEKFGRHATGNQRPMPEREQIDFLAKSLAEGQRKHGSLNEASREWHRGPGGRNDALGMKYQRELQGHIQNLFPSGQFPQVTPPASTQPPQRDGFAPPAQRPLVALA